MLHSLLSDSVETLEFLRAELLNSVENEVIDKLDMVIYDLEQALEDETARGFSAQEVLEIFGTVLNYLPVVIHIVEKIQQLVDN